MKAQIWLYNEEQELERAGYMRHGVGGRKPYKNPIKTAGAMFETATGNPPIYKSDMLPVGRAGQVSVVATF
jgi:hypothetical protein